MRQTESQGVLIFVDQFEELFSVVTKQYRGIFIEMLLSATMMPPVRIIATMRSDFYHRCVDIPELAVILENGQFPLAAPQNTLLEMITRPAERAGLEFEEGLPGRILQDTGNEPGSLALMAYTLDELYHQCQERKHLTHDAYDALGGVQGAIGKRAEKAILHLSEHEQAALNSVFRKLVEIGEQGTITRHRASLNSVTETAPQRRLVDFLTEARLLVQSRSEQNRVVVEVAHEALFRSWPRLVEWLQTTQDDFFLLKQVKQAAEEWEKQQFSPAYLWSHERLTPVYDMADRLQPTLTVVEQSFIRSEFDRLIDELNVPSTTHSRRAIIGDRLAEIGDHRAGVGLINGLPDIEWYMVDEGEITLKKLNLSTAKYKSLHIKRFFISKYPVTVAQYKAFLSDKDGFYSSDWKQILTNWEQIRPTKSKLGDQELNAPNDLLQHLQIAENRPITGIRWTEANVFCLWLTRKVQLGELSVPNVTADWVIRLPMEQEWYQAALGKNPDDDTTFVPSNDGWNPDSANTHLSGLGRTTAVGMYPHGASPFGVLDMAGNIWEWTINRSFWLRKQSYNSGSWNSVGGSANSPTFDGFSMDFMGFRVAFAATVY